MDIKEIKEIINYVKENKEENFYLIGEPVYNNKFITIEKEFELKDFIIEKINLENITVLENITGNKIDKYLDINDILEILENISIDKQIKIIKDYLEYSIIKL